MNNIFIESRRKKIETIKKMYPLASIVDVTSKGEYPWIRFSPFYPVGDIPVPFSDGRYSKTVEGLWQGLKVFSGNDVDESKFNVVNMKGIKRTVRKYGTVLGHRKGIEGELIGYLEARKCLYIPAYQYVLENLLGDEVDKLKSLLSERDLVLLDYEKNQDIENLSKPLSHASLIARYIKTGKIT